MKNLLISVSSVFIALGAIAGLYGLLVVTPNSQSEILGIEDSQASSYLTVKNVVETIENFGNEYFIITYKYEISNTSNKEILDVNALNNLAASFGSLEYEKIELSSSNFVINESFDGKNNLNLINGTDTLSPGQVSEISLKVKLYPNGSTGPFGNEITVNGRFKPEQNQDDSGAGNQDDSENPGPNNQNGNGNNNNGTGAGNPGNSPATPQPSPAYPPESDLSERTFTYFVVDLDTNTVLFELVDGQVIDLAELPTKNISIRIDVTPGLQGSLVIYDGGEKIQTENFAPFSISGDYYGINENLKPWNYTLKEYSLTVIAYTEKQGKGSIINTGSLNFTLIDSSAEDETEGNVGGGVVDEIDEEERFELTSSSASVTFLLEMIKKLFPAPVGNVDVDIDQPEVVSVVTTPPAVGENKVEKANGNILGVSDLLANTGLSLSDTLIIGMLIILVVIEINALGAERKLFMRIVDKFRGEKQQKS